MNPNNLLLENEISEYLEEIPAWELNGNTIVREISANNFAAIIGIVNSVALIAEKSDHHPDLYIYGWNKLKITVTTHSLGGLTEKDFILAKKIEELGI